jgi:formylglycine-generating enzyme required for sulfatase activity
MQVRKLLPLVLLSLLASACAANPAAGIARISPRDDMFAHYVPAGPFVMGGDPDSSDTETDELPQHTVTLAGFWIDETEVTNAQYIQCIHAGFCEPIVSPRPDHTTQPHFPAQGVSYPNAQNYCAWVGRRLPTEAEWEKAARGTQGALYPWGEAAPDRTLANFDFLHGDVLPVGSLPAGASPYGALDMAGNVYEWVLDWFAPDFYTISPLDRPLGPDTGLERVVRGGAWNSDSGSVRASNRFHAFPYRNDFDGFRCASD